ANVDVGGWYAKVAQPGLPILDARQIVLEAIVTHDPIAPPGERYQYANAGFIIAGHMAEKVTGKTWEKLIQEQLFQPLGMTSAGFGPPGAKDNLDQPRGHGVMGHPIEPSPGADNPPAMRPAATAHCSIED